MDQTTYTIIAIGVLGLIIVIQSIINASLKKEHKNITEKADRIVKDATRAIKDIKPAETITKYVTVESFNETDASYLEEISVIWNNPIFRFFIIQLQNDVLMAINENPKPELNDGLVGKSKGVELVIKTMQNRDAESQARKDA